MSEDSIISLKNVNKWFGDFHVLKDVDLEVKKKERIVVCGPSGSGKSTLIRCINRLEEHQEGTIIVDGNAGNEIGLTMRRGLIVIGGNAGDLIGFNMLAGTIMVFGESGIRHGAAMRRGTIIFMGDSHPQMLPSFRHAICYQPEFMRVMLRKLQATGFDVPDSALESSYDLYHGDMIDGGRGEILLKA